jgi:hypothetical protein
MAKIWILNWTLLLIVKKRILRRKRMMILSAMLLPGKNKPIIGLILSIDHKNHCWLPDPIEHIPYFRE